MKKCPSIIFYTRNCYHWGTEAIATAELQASPQCSHLALDQPVLHECISGTCQWAEASVHKLPISWTSTTSIHARVAGMASWARSSLEFLTSKTLGCEEKMDMGSKVKAS